MDRNYNINVIHSVSSGYLLVMVIFESPTFPIATAIQAVA